MSSSTASRRIKDRGGAGGKVMAPKLHQPQRTPKDKGGGSGEGAPAKRTPLGKENPKTLSASRFPSSSSSRPRFSVQPIPRVDKSLAAAAGDGAVRWSTSSMPLRGKPASSSDPQPPVSDITQILSGLRLSRASTGLESKPVNGLRVLERCQQKTRLSQPNEKPVNGSRAVDDLKERSLVKQMVENESNGVIGSKSARKDAVLYVNSRKPVEKLTRSAGSVELPKSKSFLASNPKTADEKVLNVVDSCKDSAITDCSVLNASKGSGGEAPNGFCVYERSNENELNKEEKKDVQVGNRYPSRLREKLALLEGKVQRIASDIKATKDMLDLNNSDASKKILLDIQSKISGIEKAIDHVVDKTPFETGLSQEVKNGDFQVKDVVETRAGQVGSLKTMMKNQNHEELEARLFPHHRLLRNRSSSTALGGEDHSCDMGKLTSDRHSEMEGGSLSPIEENPIALEFLASLNSESCKTNIIDRHDKLDFSGINYTEVGSNSNVSSQCVSMKSVNENVENYAELRSDEKLEDFDDQENKPMTVIHEESEDSLMDPLCDIGCKTSTAGWFASEGEAVLLAHNDGSCTYYDVVNMEKKAEYMPPVGISNIWGDCWLIRAAGSDGCSGKYVVAASAGNTLESGFCTWDFYTKDVCVSRIENGTKPPPSSSRQVFAPLSNTSFYGRHARSTISAPENRQWWYKPCGPLIVSTACREKSVTAYDIRDGDLVMRWEVQKPVMTMEYSSPLQWRTKGKLVVAETEAISVWDVNSLAPQPLVSIANFGRKVFALHINNTDAELGGGVRQRASSAEAEGNDGVFCTQDTINVLDFREPSGVGLKFTKHGSTGQSIFSRGDSVFLGTTDTKSSLKDRTVSRVQHFSVRKGRLISTYMLPDSNAHSHYQSITQVWGNKNVVMGICGLGLFTFDAYKDDGMQYCGVGDGNIAEVSEKIGPADMYCPTFDYMGSRVLIISRDRPAMWRYLS